MAHYKGAATEATRAMQILKRREKAKEELEQKKRKFEEDLKLDIDKKFATHYDAIESQLRTSTVGLVTLTQMREKQELAVREREKQLAQGKTLNHNLDIEKSKSNVNQKKRIKLSFGYGDDDDSDGDDEEEEEDNDRERVKNSSSQERLTDSSKMAEENVTSSIAQTEESDKKAQKTRDSPTELDIDTSYLPDKRREEEEKKMREQLALEWRERQSKLKEEDIEITFSYWDGSGHRRVATLKKGHSIYQFLQKCLELLRQEFNELRSVTADQLIYVKEDLIIPHHYTFYDFIVTKARGKSGPLFSFDVHDDVRLIADATVEKDESHAGKVLLRSWYERNKHIFPASRWEPYDPTKVYEKYTISDKKSK